MKYLFFAFYVLLVSQVSGQSESEKVFREAIPGDYSRTDGMATYHLLLNNDGAYLFDFRGCVGSIRVTKGKWVVKDDVVVLDGEGLLHHFRIYSSSRIKELSLLPLDDEKWRENNDDEERLFMRVKRTTGTETGGVARCAVNGTYRPQG
jgi:hypothetical protein